MADTADAHLAGNIWKIEVAPGDEVEEGDLLFILEAMKMEHEVLAEKAGVVAALLVKEGAAVEIGTPLLSYVGGPGSAPTAPTAPPQAVKPSAAASNGVVAPLAGTIWKLEVTTGQQVLEGDLLLVLEAMKMENEIIADRDGTVSQLLIREGDAVEIGQVLLALD
jgi:oxaloacetate decarboxylase alpha subunit